MRNYVPAHMQQLIDLCTRNAPSTQRPSGVGWYLQTCQIWVRQQCLTLLGSIKQCTTTSGDNTLRNSSTGGIQGISNAVLLLTHLNIRSTSNLDDSHATRKLGKPE